MSAGKPRDNGKERLWRRLIQQWRRSGLSVRAFCDQHALHESSFYFWRRTLAQRQAEGLTFVPVQVVAPALEAGASAGPAGAALEVVLHTGRVVRVKPGFDAPTLQRLLALLEEDPPC